MVVNVVSESEFFPKGHGVHTAYLNQVQMLREKGITVKVNSFGKADITHLQTIGPLALYKLLTSRPTVITAHVIPDSFVGSLKGIKYWLGVAKSYLRFIFNRADLVLAVAPKVKEELEKLGVKTRIEIFPNPINNKVFHRSSALRSQGRKKLGLGENGFVLMGAGQVQTRKGVQDFIKVGRELPEFIFVWMGGEPFKALTEQNQELTDLLRDLPKNVLFPGSFSYEDMPAIYNAADVFFFPSYQENAPMAIIEASSCGLPLLLRDIEEYKLLYREGYLSSLDLEGYKEAIKKLHEDKIFYKKWQDEGFKIARQFSFEMLGDKLINHYESLLSASKTSESSI